MNGIGILAIMIKKYVSIVLFSLLILVDLINTFNIQRNVVLDGDVAIIVGPRGGYEVVLSDPFGLQVLLENKVYCAPNRYFAHETLIQYYTHVPQLFHAFNDPVESLYLATALGKVMIEVFLIVLLALYITAEQLTLRNFLLSALIVLPFFHTFGFYHTIGIIDLAPSYAFAYALPIALLMLFFLPFYKSLYKEERLKLSWIILVLLAILAIFISLNGPIVPGVACVVAPCILLVLWFKAYRTQTNKSFVRRVFASLWAIPKTYLLPLSWLIFLSLYSLYIGQNNEESLWSETIPMAERYRRLPIGFYEIITSQPGIPVMLIVIYMNAGIIYTLKSEYRTKVLTTLKWIGIFSLVYILLLPLGGYRPYRPNIIRIDTFLPVNLSLIYFIGLSTFYLLTDHSFVLKRVYTGLVVIVLLWFTYMEKNDALQSNYNNTCEKEQLYKLHNSKEEIIELSGNCNVLFWWRVPESEYIKSAPATEFLRKTGVVKGKMYFFQN